MVALHCFFGDVRSRDVSVVLLDMLCAVWVVFGRAIESQNCVCESLVEAPESQNRTAGTRFIEANIIRMIALLLVVLGPLFMPLAVAVYYAQIQLNMVSMCLAALVYVGLMAWLVLRVRRGIYVAAALVGITTVAVMSVGDGMMILLPMFMFEAVRTQTPIGCGRAADGKLLCV